MNTTDSGVPVERHRAPHAHGTFLCEQCLAMLASSGNPFLDWLKECAYSLGEFVRHGCVRLMHFLDGVAVADAREHKAVRARVRPHTHEAGQRICTICLGSWQSTGLAWLDVFCERSWIIGKALLIASRYTGAVFFGLLSVLMWLIPNLLRAPSAQDPAQREWEQKRREQWEWEDERQRQWEEKRERDHNREKKTQYNQLADEFNENPHVPVRYRAEDQAQLREVNNAHRGHKAGMVSGDHLVYLAKRLLNDHRLRQDKGGR
jgi:hypothetical protein